MNNNGPVKTWYEVLSRAINCSKCEVTMDALRYDNSEYVLRR